MKDEEKRVDGEANEDLAIDPVDEKADEAMRALLKKALGGEPEVKKDPQIVLGGVQKKIRDRSKGKFYGDGWSTANARVNVLLIAVVMLIVIAIAYFALGPIGLSR